MPLVSIGAGTRIGPYEVMSRLGAGGMGEVWKARDMRLERDVAVKVLPQAFATDVDRIRRFQQEARAVAALNHPNICQIHDVGPDYLVLEYVEGSPLCGPLPDADARRLALQVASALEAAHKRGLLHRDLKPANVLVTTDGRAKLLDFGIAKLVTTDDMTRTSEGAVVGTAPYMSPEQVQGKTLDGRSDIFSFGSVLYELLSGERAFAGESSADVLSAMLRDTPRPLAASPLSRIASRCLEKDPSHRYQTMAEVRAALEDVTRAQPEAEPSIAVLPFENLSADKDNEYFGDGLAEEIINALTRIPGLKVIARTSAFAFKGKHEDIRRIASALGVATVLEGSIRKSGSRIRVTAQLITAADGSHLWSERYDRELADVFAVQDEIAAAITGALHVKLSPRRRHTPSLPAYEQYLKALFYAQRWTPDSLAIAKECFEQAIALDPLFALAHAELGHLFHRYAIYGLMPPRDGTPARARGGPARARDRSEPCRRTRDAGHRLRDVRLRLAGSRATVPTRARRRCGSTTRASLLRPLLFTAAAAIAGGHRTPHRRVSGRSAESIRTCRAGRDARGCRPARGSRGRYARGDDPRSVLLVSLLHRGLIGGRSRGAKTRRWRSWNAGISSRRGFFL